MYYNIIENARNIRLCSNSALIVKPSGHSWGHLKPSYDRRWSFSGSGNNFVSGGKIFGMPKNSRRTLWRFIFVLNSCVHFALRKAIVMASCQIVSSSCDHRCHRAFFASRRQYEGNKKLSDCLRKATRLREALAMPSCSHRIIVRWHRDGTTVAAKTAEFG